jgi:hypothetical protein
MFMYNLIILKMKKIWENINEIEKKILIEELELIWLDELIWKSIRQILNFSSKELIELIIKKRVKDILIWETLFNYLQENIKSNILKQILNTLKNSDDIEYSLYIKKLFWNYNTFDSKLKIMLKSFDIENFNFKKWENYFTDDIWIKLDWHDIIIWILKEFWWEENIWNIWLIINILSDIKKWKIKSFKKAKKIFNITIKNIFFCKM